LLLLMTEMLWFVTGTLITVHVGRMDLDIRKNIVALKTLNILNI